MSDPNIYRRLAALEKWQDTMASVELPRFIGAVYATDAAQSIATGAASVVVDFEDVIYDPLGLVTTGAGWAFTAPAAGLYQVTAAILFAGSTGWAAGERGLLEVFQDGSLVFDLDRKDNYVSGGASLLMRLQGSCAVVCAAGDTLDVRVAQSSGAPIALLNQANWNYVSITRLG